MVGLLLTGAALAAMGCLGLLAGIGGPSAAERGRLWVGAGALGVALIVGTIAGTIVGFSVGPNRTRDARRS